MAVPGFAVRPELESSRAESLRMIDDISASTDELVRRAIASHRATPAEILRRLAADPDKWVPSRVAENPTTPSDVLLAFAASADRVARSAVAKNPAAPPICFGTGRPQAMKTRPDERSPAIPEPPWNSLSLWQLTRINVCDVGSRGIPRRRIACCAN